MTNSSDVIQSAAPPVYQSNDENPVNNANPVLNGTFHPVPETPPSYVTVDPDIRAHYAHCPANVTCPYCHINVTTDVIKQPGTLCWAIFAGCLLTGLFFIFPLCFCWIPFFIPSCKDTVHSCPKCKRQLRKVPAIN